MLLTACLLGLSATTVLAFDPENFPDGSDLTHFVTRPEIKAPRLNVTKHHPDAIKDGYFFFSPYSELAEQWKTVRREHIPCQNGAHIYDGNGELVWSGACKYRNRNVHGFRPVVIDGEHRLILHVSPGNSERGVTEKEAKQSAVILNNNYEEISRPKIGNVYAGANFHEFRILPGGKNALMSIDFLRRDDFPEKNMTQVPIWSTGFHEVNLETGKGVFDWNPVTGGVGLNESFDLVGLNATTSEAPWDFLHLNSVDKSPRGDYLVSGRHTFTTYKISGKDGSLMWRLGGIKSDFVMEGDLDPHWQHHARFRFENDTHSVISLFDNAGDDQQRNPDIPNKRSSGKVILLDTASRPMTAKVLRQFDRPDGGKSPKLGSLQLIGDDYQTANALVDWAVPGYVSEHDSSDRLIMEAKFASNRFNSYRAFKFPFVGEPLERPAFKVLPIAIGKGDAASAFYVSWNGATEVASWNFYGGDSENGQFTLLANVPRSGFETSWVMPGGVKYAYAEALDAQGNQMNRSSTIMNNWAKQGTSGAAMLVNSAAQPTPASPSVVECPAQATVTQTIYWQELAKPEPTSHVEPDSPKSKELYKPKAQQIAEMGTFELVGVFCLCILALFGLYISLRRGLLTFARWRRGYRPVTVHSRESSYSDSEKPC